MPKSRLVKINDYALLEITYEDKVINTESSSFTLIDNTIQQYLQVLNGNNSELATGNVLDRSSAQLGANQWVRTEQDIPIPYLTTDSRFIVTDLATEAPAIQWNVTYDKVRVHIISGYTFTASSGFVLETSYPEANGQKNTRISTETYVNGDDYIVFNTRPLVINGTNYDKYIEFSIPSLSELITEYEVAVDKQDALAYYLTSDNQGFLENGLIRFDFYEINEVNNINGYDYLTTGVPTYVSIEPQDQFSNLAAVIKQNGDHFEYYPTWDGGFIADYIAILNETKGRYVVIHELTVSEQVGFSQLYSSSNVILQTEDFDQPTLFKPILKNADTAFSFSIDYTMRLTNETDGSQIIRTASVTSFEPKRFGKSNLKLNVREDVIPYRVYNKVTNGPVFNLPVTKQDIRVQRVIAPSFYENNNVSVSTSKLFISKSGEFIPEELFEWDIIFGQTEAIVLVNPFDNYFRFRIYRVTPDSIETLDLSDAQEIDIVFETSSGNKYRYSLYQPFPTNETAITNQINDPKNGQLIFRVPANDASRMLEDLPGKFYITVRNQNIVRARVSLDIASDLRGKEVTIPFQDWAQKTTDDLITVYNNLKPYTIEKKYLDVIEVVPDGITGEETVVYRGNVESIDNYQVAANKVEELRNNSFLDRLNAVKDREAQLNQFQKNLDQRQAQLDAKEATLKALETALLGQQQTLQDQAASLEDQRSELDRRNALLKQREEDLKRLAEEAKDKQSSAVKELSDVIRTLREEIERLSNLNRGTGNQGTGNQGTGNQGTGNQGTGNQGTGNQGTGNQGPQGGGNSRLNTDTLIDNGNFWQDPYKKGGTGDLGGGRGTGTSQQQQNRSYDVYYVNTDTFVGRYEIQAFASTAGITREEKDQLFNKEFVNDSRTNGGKYTELKRKQTRTFQSTEKPYISKWFVERQDSNNNNNNNNGSNQGATTKVRFAVLEIGSKEAFDRIRKNPTVRQKYTDTFITSTYERTIGSLTSFKVEVALDEFYQKGKDDLAQKKNTFLAGYSSYIDKLTKSTFEKEVPTVTNKTNSKEGSKTYLYGQKTKYVNVLASEMNDVNVEIGYKLKVPIDSKEIFTGWQLKLGSQIPVTWNFIFEMCYTNDGLGDFSALVPSNSTSVVDWLPSLAKFYDNLLTALFSAKDSTTLTSTITNLINLQAEEAAPKEETIRYVRVLRTINARRNPRDPNSGGTATSAAYMVKSVAADFIDLTPEFTVFLKEESTKTLPAVVTATIGGTTYTYDRKDPYQVSDWLSGLAPGTIKDSWLA